MLFCKHTEKENTRFLQNKKYVAILFYFCRENCSLKSDLLEQAAMCKQQFVQKICKVRYTPGNMGGCTAWSKGMDGGSRCRYTDFMELLQEHH